MAEYDYKTFQEILRRRTYAPVVLFHGQEDYLIDDCVDAMIAQTLDESARSFNLDVVYGGKSDPRDVIAHASSFPMMSEKRVVVVREFDRLVGTEQARATVSAYVERPLASTLFLLVAEKFDGRRKPFTDIRKNGDMVECRPLWENQIPAWTAAQFKKRGKSADAEACDLMLAYVGTSLRAMENEIEKVLIAVGDRSSVTVEDIVHVVGASRGYTIFDLQNAIGARKADDALRILARMLDLGESPVGMIVMLTKFFTSVWKAQDLRQQRKSVDEAAAVLRVRPFAAKNLYAVASQFTPEEIEQGFTALLQTDVTLKSSGIDPRIAMELLIYALVTGAPVDALRD